jgi:hypothetical protein
MTASSDNHVGAASMMESEATLERSSLLGKIAPWSLPRKLSWASAALFAGIAARGTESAYASFHNWNCCSLARMDRWCQGGAGPWPFVCNYGGYKRAWFCCYMAQLYGCGECNDGGPTCWDGPFYCSYGWLEFPGC